MTHTSFFNQKERNEVYHFQRLEFLGDSIINLIVSEYLYSKFPFSPEGELSKMKSNIISQSFLANIANSISLDKYIILGKSVDLRQGRGKFSILADCFEACLGAVFLDGGLDSCQKIIHHFLELKNIEFLVKNQINDYKTFLQEFSQKNFQCLPVYRIIKEEGLEHPKIFYIEVYIDNVFYGEGRGRNKKEAEQDAANHALKKLGAL